MSGALAQRCTSMRRVLTFECVCLDCPDDALALFATHFKAYVDGTADGAAPHDDLQLPRLVYEMLHHVVAVRAMSAAAAAAAAFGGACSVLCARRRDRSSCVGFLCLQGRVRPSQLMAMVEPHKDALPGSSAEEVVVEALWLVGLELTSAIKSAVKAELTVAAGASACAGAGAGAGAGAAKPPSADAVKSATKAALAKSSQLANLASTVRALVDMKAVRSAIVMERLDGELLAASRLVADAAKLRRRCIRMNTKMMYTQNKFNLLREDAEGFAKLLVELLRPLTPCAWTAVCCCVTRASYAYCACLCVGGSSDAAVRHAQHAVAGRVLSSGPQPGVGPGIDIVRAGPLPGVGSNTPVPTHPHPGVSLSPCHRVPFHQKLGNACYLDLVDLFRSDHLPHVLGFRFQSATEAQRPTPSSLYRLAATLIASGRLTVEALAPHLAPSLKETAKAAKSIDAAMQAQITSFTTVNLSGGGPVASGGLCAAALC